jgi:hypothetical protein
VIDIDIMQWATLEYEDLWKLSAASIIVFETDCRQVYKALWKSDLDVCEEEEAENAKMPK